VLSQPLLYLSLYLKQHRAEYYRLLDLVRAEGDWEAWLDFFLEAVAEAAVGAVDTARRLVTLFEEDSRRARSLGRSTGTALRVLDALRARPLITINDVCRRTGMTFPTATKGMATLVKLDIARELTSQRRNRVFAYRRYLEVLNEGTEPL
jgi:Fic family protein